MGVQVLGFRGLGFFFGLGFEGFKVWGSEFRVSGFFDVFLVFF